MRYLLTGFIFVLLLIGSCNRHSAEWSTLLSVEEWIIDNPDSAMNVLEALDTTRLSSEEEMALYGLLLTMAQEKTNIVVADDSLIRSAARYFEDKGDQRREMIANCYLGMVRYDLERYSEAIVNYYKAKEIAEKVGDWFYAGLACRGLSDIYNESLNKDEELSYAEQEVEYFQKSGRQPYINYAMLDLSRALYNHSDFEKALDLTRQLVDSAAVARDDYLLICTRKLEVESLIHSGQYEKAIPKLKEIIDSGVADSKDSIRYWASLIFTDRRDEAERYENQNFSEDTPWHHVMKYMVYKYEGRIHDALNEHEAIDSIRDVLESKAMNNNINGSLVGYVEVNKKLTDAKLRSYRLMLWLIIVSIIFIAFIITLFLLKLFRRLRSERDNKVNFAEELQENLTESERKCEELSGILNKEKEIQKSLITQLDEERLKMKELFLSLTENKSSYDKLSQEFEVEKTARKILVDDLEEERTQRQLLIEHMAKEKEEAEHRKEIIKTLFSGQYQYLEGIISAIQESKDSATAKRRIANSMTGFVDELSYQSKKVKELEKKVDTIYKSLMSDFRSDLPKLKEIDYRLFLFSVMGFSIPSISMLLKVEKIEDVYNRKRHLKDKIKRLDSRKAERYLSYLI